MIKATGIHKHFNGLHAVKGVDITVEDGEVLCIIGLPDPEKVLF